MSSSLPMVPDADAPRFGEWLNIGFQAFTRQWQSWLIVMLTAAGISLLALAFCIFPILLVLGPLSCGLHYCGVLAVRGERIDSTALSRGWELAGRSMIAYLGMQMMQMIPAMLLYGLFVGGFFAMMAGGALVPPGGPAGARPMGPRGAPGIGFHFEDFSQPPQVKRIPGAAEQAGSETEAGEQFPAQEGGPAGGGRIDRAFDLEPAAPGEIEQAGSIAVPVNPNVIRPGMPGNREIAFFGTLFVMYGLMLLGGLAIMVWTVWFGMKTMFVMPLIADRGCSFGEALTESWRLTAARPWELLLLYGLAMILSSLGAYACYIGLLATMPVYFTIIAAAYERHALPQFIPPQDDELVPGAEIIE